MESDEPCPEGVSAFIEKVWRMTNDPDTDDLISWSQDGESLFIQDSMKFSRILLPRYYKHNNLASFIRQLNKYGFRKITPLEQPSMDLPLEFAHKHFLRSKPERLIYIKRKSSSKEVKDAEGGSASNNCSQDPAISNEILRLVTSQEIVDLDISTMKQEMSVLKRKFSVAQQKQKNMKKALISVLEVLNEQNRVLEKIAGPAQSSRHVNEILARMPSIEDDSSSDENSETETDAFHDWEQPVGENSIKTEDMAFNEEVLILDSDSDDGYAVSKAFDNKFKRKAVTASSQQTPKLPKRPGIISARNSMPESSVLKKKGTVVLQSDMGGLKKFLEANERVIVSPSALVKIAGRRQNGFKPLSDDDTAQSSSEFVLVAKEYRPGNITSELVLSRNSNTRQS